MSRTETPDAPLTRLADFSLPGDALPSPSSVPTPEVVQVDPLVGMIDEALHAALQQVGVRAYFEVMRRDKPELFFKYVQLVVAAKQKPGGGPTGKTFRIISPLGHSPLDADPT